MYSATLNRLVKENTRLVILFLLTFYIYMLTSYDSSVNISLEILYLFISPEILYLLTLYVS